MANTPEPQILEGKHTNRPPLFIGSDYGNWKTRMTTYIKASRLSYLESHCKWSSCSHKTMEEQEIPKLENEWDENNVKLIELNYKAINCLCCALDPNEFDRISSCYSAKAIWDKLEATYEGSSQVEESKMSMLVQEHKLSLIEKDECTSISLQASNDEEDSTEVLCLMAYEDEVTSKLNSLEDNSL